MRANFLNDARLFRIGCALSVALLLAIVLSKNNLVFQSGDFPALYGQLKILQSGAGEQLYDFATQQKVQSIYFPNSNGTFLPGVYPPYYYLFFEPLGNLSAPLAKLLWDSAALIAFLLCIELIAQRNPFVRRNAIFVSCLLLLTPCFMAAVFGGQNTCFTLLATLSAGIFMSWPSKRAQLLGGALLGLLFLKPQYGALALIVVLFSRSVAVAIGYLLMALYFGVITTLQFGDTWALEWLASVGPYARSEYSLSIGQMTSCDAALAWILTQLRQPLPLFLPLFGALVGLIGWLGLGAKKLACLKAGERDFFYLPVAWLSILPLVSPHTIYYDLGLALAAAVTVGTFESDRARASAIALWVLLMVYGWMRTQMQVPLLFIFAIVIAASVYRFMLPGTFRTRST